MYGQIWLCMALVQEAARWLSRWRLWINRRSACYQVRAMRQRWRCLLLRSARATRRESIGRRQIWWVRNYRLRRWRLRVDVIVKDGAIKAGQTMNITLSSDHRLIDGTLGAQFMAKLKALLENPIQLIA